MGECQAKRRGCCKSIGIRNEVGAGLGRKLNMSACRNEVRTMMFVSVSLNKEVRILRRQQRSRAW